MISTLIRNLQAVFDSFSGAVLVETAERKVQMVNRRFLDMFGLDVQPGDMVGMDCSHAAKQVMYLMADPEAFLDEVTEVMAEARAQKSLVTFADGRAFTRSYTPVHENGELALHVWTYEEVTQLKDKEEELLAQKEFFHKVLNEIPADIAIFSPGHRYIYINKTAVKNDGIRNWMIGKDDYEYVEMRGLPVEIAHGRRARFNEAKEKREAVTWVDKHTTPDGTVNHVLRIFYPYINTSGEMEFVIGYGVNINHQVQNEQLIQQEKERFRTLIDTLNDGVFQVTFDGTVQLYNRSFLRAMHLQDADITGPYRAEIMDNVHPEDKPTLYAAFDRLKETLQPQQGMFRAIQPGGEMSYIEYYIWHRHTEADGDVVAGRLSDVTERELREQQMQGLIKKEKELNNMKSHFIHITSHELRTPLAVIMSSAEILDMCNGQDEAMMAAIDARGMTAGIVKEVNRITGILDELLMLGRIESGRVKFDPVATSVKHYLHQVAAEMYLPHDDGRMLELNMENVEGEVHIDRSLMRHAVMNLLNNAFKYSAGKPAPVLSAEKQGNYLVIKVKDHGIGIPEQDRQNLFTSFYRASNVGNISGTGIGLMVVDHVVKTHNGTINVQTTQGAGTEFTMTLPVFRQ